MKKTLIVVGVILVIVFILYRFFVGTYNNLVERDVQVQTAWSQVENVYQRRLDLIPNLVSTVKEAADFEKSTLTAVIEARANATQVKIDPKNLTAEQMTKFQEAQGQLGSALGRLMVVVEQYPQLKANQNFLELQSQLEGTENRINVARQDYNKAVEGMNLKVKRFPGNILASIFGFSEKAFYEADKGSEKNPDIKFDIK